MFVDLTVPTDTLAISYGTASKFFEELSSAELSQLQTALESVSGEITRSELIVNYRCNRLFSRMSNDEKNKARMDPLTFFIGTVGASWGYSIMFCEEKFPHIYCSAEEMVWETVDPNEEFPPRETVVERTEDLVVLRRRADICTNFPVIIDKISEDDIETVYAVLWHNVNLRANKRASGESEDTIYSRLIAALNASRKTGKWSVEPARRELDLCSLVMRSAAGEKPAELVLPETTVHDAEDTKPKLTRLNHIKELFPVIWHEVSDKTFAIEIFGKKLKEMGGDRTKVTAQLLAALKDSPAWIVKPAVAKNEVARILMK